jgi:hypothetical protein
LSPSFSIFSRPSNAQFAASRKFVRDFRIFECVLRIPEGLVGPLKLHPRISRNAFALRLLCNPLQLTPCPSQSYKNTGGHHSPISISGSPQIPVDLGPFARLSRAESTFVRPPVSVAYKELTGQLSPLDSALMKNSGVGCYCQPDMPRSMSVPSPLRRRSEGSLFQFQEKFPS